MSDIQATAGEQSTMGLYLREIGRRHGLSSERVRQIEKKALRKIRASDCVQDLKACAN